MGATAGETDQCVPYDLATPCLGVHAAETRSHEPRREWQIPARRNQRCRRRVIYLDEVGIIPYGRVTRHLPNMKNINTLDIQLLPKLCSLHIDLSTCLLKRSVPF